MKHLPDEMRELHATALLYSQGKTGLGDLYAHLGMCEAASVVQLDHAAYASIREFQSVVSSAWNELGINRNALSESEFRAWLQTWLEVWELDQNE